MNSANSANPDGPQSDVYPGVVISVFTAALVGIALIAFGFELARVNSVLALIIDLIIVGGASPTVWRWRHTPVWRWTVYGFGVGGVFSVVVLLVNAL